MNATDAGVAALWLRATRMATVNRTTTLKMAPAQNRPFRNSSSEHAGLPYLVADEPTTAGKPGCNTARFLWERIIEDRATTCVQRF